MSEALKSKEFQDIKKSVEQGTYEYCDLNYCKKYVAELATDGDSSLSPGRVHYVPEVLHLGVDGTCNIRCKSCRDSKYSERYEDVKERLLEIENTAAPFCKRLDLSSAGEFLASRATREWLQNLDLDKWKNLRSIHLRTNGLLFTEEFWNSLRKEVRNLVTGIQVSVDATTKEVYESVREGASWELLQKNLDFIYSLNKPLQISFVIQAPNHFQILDFHRNVKELQGKNIKVSAIFQPVEKWPGVSEENFKALDIYSNLEVWRETWRQLQLIGQESLIKEPPFYPTLKRKTIV